MTRAEHMQWCKQRAMEYAERGRLLDAVTSMGSDLNKHEETRGISGPLLLVGALYATDGDRAAVIHWINGFAD